MCRSKRDAASTSSPPPVGTVSSVIKTSNKRRDTQSCNHGDELHESQLLKTAKRKQAGGEAVAAGEPGEALSLLTGGQRL